MLTCCYRAIIDIANFSTIRHVLHVADNSHEIHLKLRNMANIDCPSYDKLKAILINGDGSHNCSDNNMLVSHVGLLYLST